MNRLMLVILLFHVTLSYANSELDSLYASNKIHTTKEKIALFYTIIKQIKSTRDTKLVDAQIKNLRRIAEDIRMDSITTDYNLNNAVYLTKSGHLDSSIAVYNENILFLKQSPFKKRLMENYRGLGINYGRKGSYEKALEQFLNSLKLAEQINDIKGKASAFNNMGIVEYNMKNYDKAIQYYLNSIAIKEELKDTVGLSYDYQNIGGTYFDLEQYEKSLEYSEKTYQLTKSINDVFGMGLALISKGLNHKKMGHLDLAHYTFLRADSIGKMVNEPWFDVTIGNSLGSIYFIQGKYEEAIEKYLVSVQITKELQMNKELKESYEGLAAAYEATNRPIQALEYFKLFEEVKDTIFNQTKLQQINDLEIKYESDKKDSEIKLLNKTKQLNEAKIKEQEYQKYVFGVVILALLLISYFIYRNLAQKKRANQLLNDRNREIEKQKDVIEEKHKEIQDSINYAKRIQTALLTADEQWEKVSSEHFVFLKPKDVVSGDFFWAYAKDNLAIWAAADCTGHGVPGAFMSMLGVGFLSEIVVERGETKANAILDILREKIIRALEQKGISGEQKDGMDIALCVWDKASNTLQYSGAYNPLYVIRNGVLEEYKADRQPIGKFHGEGEAFTSTVIKLEEGDVLYTFSDGYIDQFGGPGNKRFMSKRFKELLLSIQHKSMEEQKVQLNETFELWVADSNNEQIDDVCVVGVKV